MLEPGVQVVHHLQPLQVNRIVVVSPARFALEPTVPDQHAAGPLDDRDGVLVDCDGNADAELLAK